MIKLDFNLNNRKRSFVLNKRKYIVINENSDYWIFNRCIKHITENIPVSEYGNENDVICNMLIDGEPLSKADDFYFINHHFNIDDDLKLGSKSLTLKYLINRIVENSYSDYYLQAESMLRILSDYLSDDSLCFESIELNHKTIPKLLSAYMLKEDLKSSGLDLTYDETIIRQLDLLENSFNNTKRVFAVVELYALSETLKQYIDSLNNLHLLVFFAKTSVKSFEDNIFIDNIDFQDDESLYERMVNMSNSYNLFDYKNKLKAEHLKTIISE